MAADGRFRELFMTALDGYVITDERGLIADANPAAAALLGAGDPATVRGTPLAIALAPGHRKIFFELLYRLRIEGADTAEAEVTCASPRHGIEVPCLLRMYAGRGADGVIDEVRCVLRDLRERDRARQAEGLAEAMRHRDELLAQLGHELRNPLAPLSTLISLLRHDRVEDRHRPWVHDVLDRQMRHLGRLIDDMVDAARLTRGSITLYRQPVDLGDMVRAELDAFSTRMVRRRHTVWSDTAARITVDADPTRLRQIIDNLLDNACKYTPPGGNIWVETGAAGDCAWVRVRDDGIGIVPGRLEQVFEPYHRASQVPADGLGLGLALVRHLVELHGGQVRAHSDGHGRGAELVIELPRCQDDSSVDRAATPRLAAAPRRVLVVDDDLDTAEALALALRDSGHDVRVACDAQTALTTARHFFPELGLIDLGMPDVDGFELARRLAGEHRGLRLIAVTGYADTQTRARVKDSGFAAHLPKPVDLEQLEQAVARA